MSVDRAEVERIAHLARLALDQAEVQRLTQDMNDILTHATVLRELAHAAPPMREGRSAVGGSAPESGSDSSDDRPRGGVRDPVAESPHPAGATRDAVTETLDPPAGTRDVAAETPDPLAARPEAFAPRMADGFFVVPPPPGVTAEDEPVATVTGVPEDHPVERERDDDGGEPERAKRD